jgi:Ethylbenzene dehydrogenase
MRGRVIRSRRTDYGTVILHWSLVCALAVALLSGLKIAAEAPDRSWINLLDSVLPGAVVWSAHVDAALALAGVAVAYAVYMWRARLTGRVRLSRMHLSALTGCGHLAWTALNVSLNWVFYLAMLSQLATGGLLYFDRAGSTVLALHWFGAWVIASFPILHLVTQWKLGRFAQLLRMFRPARLVSPPPPLDMADLLELLAKSSQQTKPAMQARGPEHDIARSGEALRRHGTVLQSNPFVVATAIAVAGMAVMVTADRNAVETLHIRHIGKAETPVLDGDTSDPVWRTASPVSVVTGRGDNFDGEGGTTVEIRAVHDGDWAYFLFVWNDPTRSLKQLPLRKSADGWHLLHDGYELGDEHTYNEDKFSALLTRSDAVLAGDNTFHAGPVPAAGKPGSLHGRGLHYTTGESALVEVWQWKATSSGPVGWCDDDYFGPPAEPTQAQLDGKVPYRGGFAPDPGAASYLDNFEPRAGDDHRRPVKPRRLPGDFKATALAMGRVDLDPDHGESEAARWYMTESESEPYSAELDAQIPVGTIIPGVIMAGEFSGERASVRCVARWQSGRWALEAARRLDSKSRFHIPIGTGTYLRVAAFDHAQVRHTRHVRPIRLEVE